MDGEIRTEPKGKHPMQPVIVDDKGTHRFKLNAIVDYILDHGSIDLNKISRLDFSQEDRVQFAQLMGYSVSGFGDLGYVDGSSYAKAQAQSSRLAYKNKPISEIYEAEAKAFNDRLTRASENHQICDEHQEHFEDMLSYTEVEKPTIDLAIEGTINMVQNLLQKNADLSGEVERLQNIIEGIKDAIKEGEDDE